MSIVWMSAASAAGFYLILRKVMSRKAFLKTNVFWDVLLTLGLPLLFLGTFSGMITAILTGLIFTIGTALIKKFNL
jgi:hypothetical protein|tara:strand:+ start:225 stop:452 length:228 start_codon:yes stop_codon:yes gene_type:complete